MLTLAYTASANVPVIKSDPKIEAQVEQTLKKLTLEEKIGQMMELVTDLFGANDKNGVFYIDEHKTDSILSRYKIGSANVPVIKSDPKIEAQVEQTLKKLTLEEKIGQMMELVTDLFGANDKNGVFYIDEHKTDSILSRYKIGSILNAPNTCAPTAKQWEKYIAQIQKISMKRIGIPCVFGLDQNHGSTYTQDGTLFPQNINVAATFNRDIARRSAEATAYETRAVSVPWTYSPTVDLGRDARWPRIWENFGEDCYLKLAVRLRLPLMRLVR